jgi:hypothetical protein
MAEDDDVYRPCVDCGVELGIYSNYLRCSKCGYARQDMILGRRKYGEFWECASLLQDLRNKLGMHGKNRSDV